MRDEDLDEILRRQPFWEPPADFAGTVVARGLTRTGPRPAIEHRSVFDALRAAYLGVVAAAVMAFAGLVLLWLMPLVTTALVANALPVAWTCAAVSLLVATWFTTDRRGWI